MHPHTFLRVLTHSFFFLKQNQISTKRSVQQSCFTWPFSLISAGYFILSSLLHMQTLESYLVLLTKLAVLSYTSILEAFLFPSFFLKSIPRTHGFMFDLSFHHCTNRNLQLHLAGQTTDVDCAMNRAWSKFQNKLKPHCCATSEQNQCNKRPGAVN